MRILKPCFQQESRFLIYFVRSSELNGYTDTISLSYSLQRIFTVAIFVCSVFPSHQPASRHQKCQLYQKQFLFSALVQWIVVLGFLLDGDLFPDWHHPVFGQWRRRRGNDSHIRAFDRP